MSRIIVYVGFVLALTSLSLQQGYRCPNANFRLFVTRSGPEDLWHGTLNEASAMCENNGHVLARSASCIREFFQSSLAADIFTSSERKAWIDQELRPSNETGCAYWSHVLNKTATVSSCSEKFAGLCQGLSTADFHLSESEAGPAEDEADVPAVEFYYILCGILGFVLIGIVVFAAIWRSGYINNRYSFRRMEAARLEREKPKKTPKSRTVTSQLDSEVPSGYVKTSVTKETIA